jgi:hypothetical protein
LPPVLTMLTGLVLLASISLVPVTADTAGGPAATGAVADAQRLHSQVQDLSDDIDLLAKLNRLQLTHAQMQGLLAVVQKRQALHAAALPKRAEVFTALAQALQQKRQLLLKDQPVPDQLEDKIAQLNTEIQALTRSENESALKLSDEVHKLLTAPQWALLTGRSEAERSALQQIEWLRGLPGAQYEDEADGAAEELANPGAGLTSEKVRAIFDRAREMKPAAFAQEKTKLAEELLPAYAMSPQAEQETVLDLVSNARLAPLLEDMLAARGGQGNE